MSTNNNASKLFNLLPIQGNFLNNNNNSCPLCFLFCFYMLSLKPQTISSNLNSFSFPANFQIMAPFQHFLFVSFVFIPASLANNTTNLNYHSTNNNITSINHNTSSSIPNASSPFKPSSALFVFVAILSILFCIIFLLLIYSKRCATDNNTNNPFVYAHSSSLLSVSAGRNSGINRVVVESLPLFRFSSLSGSKDGLECAVCLTRFEPNELLRLLPKCKHAFHAECVDTWLEAHSTCPLCRYRVDPEDILLIQDQDLSLSFGSGAESVVPSRTRRVSGRHTYAGGERARTSGGGKTTTLGSYRKDGLLLLERKRLEHRIIISGSGRGDGSGTELGSGFHQRWSDVQPSDMLYLRSEMIISQSRRLGVRSLVAEAGAGNNYKNNVEKDDGNGKEKKVAERGELVEEQ